MKFKTEVHYTLETTDFIDKAFKQLPTNAFIDKGRCAIRATSMEISDKSRCTIITVPTCPIIDSKTIINDWDTAEEIERKKSVFPVRGGVTVNQIAEYLDSDLPYKKIMTTPDSFEKIIKAALQIGKLPELYNTFFLLIDEGHSAATESYREHIAKPFKYFWKFKDKSVMSATPFIFTDPRFKELTLHKIRFKNTIGNVKVVDAKNPMDTLIYILKGADSQPKNVHIFFNSVTEIGDAVRLAGLTECSIYCSDKDDNRVKLKDEAKFFHSKPDKSNYSKINLYTTSYFEGWDLYDDNATLILVTDVNREHTKVGITNKGKQALGRIRGENANFFHITNHRNFKTMKSKEQLYNEYLFRADKLITRYNDDLAEYNKIGAIPLKEEMKLISLFAEIDENTLIATLNYTKVDQLLNEQICAEEFNNIVFILKAWEDSLFDVTLMKHEVPKELKPSSDKRISKRNAFAQTIGRLKALEQQKKDFLYSFACMQIQQIKVTEPFAYNAYFTLGYEKIEELKFNIKAVQRDLTLISDANAEIKLLKLLDSTFDVGRRYTKSYIKDKLQELYKSTGIERLATAEQIKDIGRYDVQPCKLRGANGQFYHGFLIMRKQFDLKTAA